MTWPISFGYKIFVNLFAKQFKMLVLLQLSRKKNFLNIKNRDDYC